MHADRHKSAAAYLVQHKTCYTCPSLKLEVCIAESTATTANSNADWGVCGMLCDATGDALCLTRDVWSVQAYDAAAAWAYAQQAQQAAAYAQQAAAHGMPAAANGWAAAASSHYGSQPGSYPAAAAAGSLPQAASAWDASRHSGGTGNPQPPAQPTAVRWDGTT